MAKHARAHEAPAQLVWLRQDLRLDDNPALAEAAATGRPLLLLYVLDEAEAGPWAPGAASLWWLHHSLAAFAGAVAALGQRLILARGSASRLVPDIARASGCATILWNQLYEPWAMRRDDHIKAALTAEGREVRCHPGNVLVPPHMPRTRTGGPYRVFTPYWRWMLAHEIAAPTPKVERLPPPPDDGPQGERLEAWKLLPTRPDWAGGLRAAWTPGEAGAQIGWRRFRDIAASYAARRDRPDLDASSRLSPHLHHGEIGVRRLWHECLAAAGGALDEASGATSFCRELAWRDFSRQLLFHNPHLPEAPLDRRFAAMTWRDDPAGLRAWQLGRTGYPIVDAGLRQLWRTGWMHNRVRMIAASFLIKDLLVDWRAGAAWFWDTLVDADLANNATSWQWVAGSGADAAPFFRVFNPVAQGERFDPTGDYVRRYVPELAGLPAALIHRPWMADAATLARAGIVLGRTYPHRLVEHDAARVRALAALAEMRAASSAEEG